MGKDDTRAIEALEAIVRLLTPLDDSARMRVLKSVQTFFHLSAHESEFKASNAEVGSHARRTDRPQFSDQSDITPKEFLLQKQPKTDVERVACLAYYLTHFRNTPYFKTLDIAKLNTEAAQPKFSNAAYASSNAAISGYLAPAPKGQRQISAAGEQFVLALPDREAAKQAIALARRKKNARRKK